MSTFKPISMNGIELIESREIELKNKTVKALQHGEDMNAIKLLVDLINHYLAHGEREKADVLKRYTESFIDAMELKLKIDSIARNKNRDDH